MGSWHLPLRPSPPPSLRLMPMPTTATAMALVATTVATDHMVSDTAMASTTARGRLRLSPRLMPITDTEATDLADSTVATGLTVSDMVTVSTTTARGRLSPTTVSTLLTTLLPLLLRRILWTRSRIQELRRIR